MSYKSKNGSTNIRSSDLHNLGISYDTEKADDPPSKRKPVLLYTPHMEDTDTHYHVELSRAQAKRLYQWLDAYLADTATPKQKCKYCGGTGVAFMSINSEYCTYCKGVGE